MTKLQLDITNKPIKSRNNFEAVYDSVAKSYYDKHKKMPIIGTGDIETAPHLAYVWDMWEQNLTYTQIKEERRVLMFGTKLYNTNKLEVFSEDELGHKNFVKESWHWLDNVDIFINYNGPSFDVKHLQTEFIKAGMNQPSPYRNVDLLQIGRKYLKMPNNKLDTISQILMENKKLSHSGFKMWIDVLNKDPKAWALMKKYCGQDVRLTEDLFDRYGSWATNMPNLNMWRKDCCCPRCGATTFIENGIQYTPARNYLREQCTVCGTYVRRVGNNKMTVVK